MIGKQDRSQRTLFIPGSLEQLVPDDHVLKRVDKVLDLTWLREEVRECYDETNGRPSIDPEAAVRLMLAGFFQGIVHDRKLMREAEVNLAIRWFAGYELLEKLPDHSSLTRIRQRWGAERFRRIFGKTVEACVKAGLVDGETIHADATLIRADVSWKSLTTKHVDEVLEANSPEDDPEGSGGGGPKPGRPRKHPEIPKKRSTTDPDCTMSTSNRQERLQPSYKQHTTVDDKAGVVVDVELTTGEVSEGKRLPEVIERAESVTGKHVACVTGDGGYAQPANYRLCEDRGTAAVIPPQLRAGRAKRVPSQRFRYDAKHDLVRCPMRRVLRPSYRAPNGWIYKARSADCSKCVHRAGCVTRGAKARTLLIIDDYGPLLRAKRQWVRRDEQARRLYRRHRWQVEGKHGEAKTQHGLRRAVRRGLWNVAIQAYLTASVMNLKVLAGLLPLLSWLQALWGKRCDLAETSGSIPRGVFQNRPLIADDLDAAA